MDDRAGGLIMKLASKHQGRFVRFLERRTAVASAVCGSKTLRKEKESPRGD